MAETAADTCFGARRHLDRRSWPGAVMLLARICLVPAIVTGSCSSCGTLAVVPLQPDTPANVRVGDLAEVRVAADTHSSVGSAGTSLVLVKRTEKRGTTVYVYRAVAVGRQTLVLTPRDPAPDGCVSCITVHYFVTVA